MPDRYLAEDRIRRIGCPEDLKSKEENEWAGGRGTEVWAMLSAAMRGDLQAVQDLVATNPRLATCSYGYRSPLHFAVQGNHIEVVQFLLAQGADATFQSGVFWHIQPLLTAEERAAYYYCTGHSEFRKCRPLSAKINGHIFLHPLLPPLPS